MPSYLQYLLTSRLKELALIQSQQKFLDDTLLETHVDISDYLSRAAGDMESPIRVARLTEIQAQIEVMMDGSMNNIRNEMVKNMTLSAKYASDGRMVAGQVFLNEVMPEMSGIVPRMFATIPRDAVRATVSRLVGNKTFSDRIWDLRKFSQDAIAKTLTKGIIQGKSAYQISRELEAFLLMRGKGLKTFDQKWSAKHGAGWKQPWKQRGSFSYNAYRLARTEINNSFREASILSAQRAPWVNGVKWNLSGSHKEPDICDVYASQDIDGLGKGIYKPENAPTDHPNGLCFLTDSLAEPEQARELIMQYAFGDMEEAA